MAEPALLRKLSTQTKVYVLVAEAQEGQLAASEMAELADLMAADEAERATITQTALEKLILVNMPAGRVEDLRRAFATGSVTSGPPSTSSPARKHTTAVPASPAAAEALARSSSSQQTRQVTPAFKVPFAEREKSDPAKEVTRVPGDSGIAEAPIPAPVAEPGPPEPEPESAEETAEVMDTGEFAAEWSDLEQEVKKAAKPLRPKPKVPKGPLPVRGKAAQILQQGSTPPAVRRPTSTMPRSSAEPVMRRDTMQFGSHVRTLDADQPTEKSSRPVILVADDDNRIRMVFRLKLDQKGFRVVEAENGNEAWKMLQKGGINAAVLDMKMPGLHGLEVLQRLANSDKQIPVVVCTAYDRLDDEFVVATYPKLRYLTKPVDADQLAETLFNLLAEERTG